jgi:ubiquinone/menaquinone biosynthesis C-methylase UbiE
VRDFQSNWYRNSYNEINVSARSQSIFSKALHRALEARHKSNLGLNILEVGSHKGEHTYFVKNDWQISGSYIASDLRSLIPREIEDLRNLGVSFEIQNVEDLTYPDEQFDRVISTCLFHHLRDPIKGLEEVRRVTKLGGEIDILLPNDPGLIYRFLRRQTSLRKAKKMHIRAEAELVHALEHRNHFLSLFCLAAEVFRNDSVKVVGFPFYFNIYSLNAFTVLRIKKR